MVSHRDYGRNEAMRKQMALHLIVAAVPSALVLHVSVQARDRIAIKQGSMCGSFIPRLRRSRCLAELEPAPRQLRPSASASP